MAILSCLIEAKIEAKARLSLIKG